MRKALFALELRCCTKTRWTQSERCSRIWTRNKATHDIPPRTTPVRQPNTSNAGHTTLPSPTRPSARPLPKDRVRMQQVVIYHAGTGKIAFIGMMRLTTILIFAVSCTVVGPAYYASEEFPWYIAPAIIACAAVPMLFISYTSAPFVNQVYLHLPAVAQQSRANMLSYLKSVPRNAKLNIETMKFNFYPKRVEVSLSDLVPSKSITRPVSFMNTNPQAVAWWKPKERINFFTPEKNRPTPPTSRFFPEVWEQVFSQIKKNGASR
ncbi:hypothetical protein AJ80_06095 [Polytolypa hystricis UAMH7299]|uniref:Uncharacterized protein n=1 Tax=Polytolypa hystricis (strain UAMH7299) TaxID=1447883 RepID=A0A2B7XYI8_POLH7|nr:hypothetical protein AJ80_06095 [Polytolypa hystricis UAMH7299]